MWLRFCCVVALAVVSTSCVLGPQCGAAQQLDGPVGADQPPALLAAGGELFLAWSARTGDRRQVVRVATWNACGWDRLGEDLAAPAGGSLRNPAPRLAMTPQGLVLLTVDGTGETFSSARLLRWDGTTWSLLGQYDSEEAGTPRVTAARLRVDSSGAPWLFIDREPLSAPSRHLLLRWDGTTLAEAVPSPSTTPEGGGWLDFDLDAQGRPTVVWAASATATQAARWTGTAWERSAPLAATATAFALEGDGTPLALTVSGQRGCQVMAHGDGGWIARGGPAGAYDDGERSCQQLTVDPVRGLFAGWTERTSYERPGIYVRRLSGHGWEPVVSAVRDSDDAARIAFALVEDRTAPALAWTEVPLGAEQPVLFVRVPEAPVD